MAQIPIFQLLPDIAQIVRKAPTATLIRAYNRAARQFCHESRWLRFTLRDCLTEIDQAIYNFGSDADLEVIGIKAISARNSTGQGNQAPWNLRASPQGGWLPTPPNGAPIRYAYIPNGAIALNPPPNKVYVLDVTLVLQPVLNCNSVPDTLLARYDQVLQKGALAYLLEIKGQPWSDPQGALLKRAEFQAGIGNARADEQRDYQVGTFIAKKAPFIVGRM